MPSLAPADDDTLGGLTQDELVDASEVGGGHTPSALFLGQDCVYMHVRLLNRLHRDLGT